MCGTSDGDLSVYKVGACIGFGDGYFKNECFLDTGMGERSYYSDPDCTVSSGPSTVVAVDTCLSSFMISCASDASILQSVRGKDLMVVFEDQSEFAAGDYRNAKAFFTDSPIRKIRNLPVDAQMACNSNIDYGTCVDTTNMDSYARIPTSFTTSNIQLYGKRNGNGMVSTFHSTAAESAVGEDYFVIRYPVKGWYETHLAPI